MGPGRIISFDTWKKNGSSCFCLFLATLAFLSRFLFSASCLLFFTTSRLKTQAPCTSDWMRVSWACCYVCIFAVRSFVLVRFNITQSAIASIAAFRALCRKVSFGKLRVPWRNSDTNSSTSVTWSIFTIVGDIWPEKRHVQIGVLALGKMLFAVFIQADSFLNIVDRLYSISSEARNANRILWIEISCCLAFCMEE